MSFNQPRGDRSDPQYRRGGRSSSFSQKNCNYSGSSGKGGGAATPPQESNLPPNRSFSKKSNNVQGGQSGAVGHGVNLNSDSNSDSASRPAPNGSHLQPPVPAPIAQVAGSFVKPTTEPPPQRIAPIINNAPSQDLNVKPDLAPQATPTKGPGDASKSFPIQFGSVSPGTLNVMQIPARTSSAPPNLVEQQRDQVPGHSTSDSSFPSQSLEHANYSSCGSSETSSLVSAGAIVESSKETLSRDSATSDVPSPNSESSIISVAKAVEPLNSDMAKEYDNNLKTPSESASSKVSEIVDNQTEVVAEEGTEDLLRNCKKEHTEVSSALLVSNADESISTVTQLTSSACERKISNTENSVGESESVDSKPSVVKFEEAVKPVAEFSRFKSSVAKQKADAAGNTSDLYNAFKGPEEKKELEAAFDTKELVVDYTRDDVKCNEKAVPDDWEDAADISTPKLENAENSKVLSENDEYELMAKKYSRDFSIKLSEQCVDFPLGFEIPSDMADACMVGNLNVSRTPTPVIHKAERKYQVRKITDEEENKQRQLKAILDKLTPQNFGKLFEQVKAVKIDNIGTLIGVVSQIHDKALMKPTFCKIYANLCYHLAGELPDFSEEDEKITFKRLLLNKCQEEFDRAEREQEEADRADAEGEVQQSPAQREEKRIQARRRMLGNIRLIGELYKKRMLTERIMNECIKKLLGQYSNPDEENIESLCTLISIIGEMIDHPKAKEHMDAYFDMMLRLSNNMELSSRVRFMLKDAIDLRKNKWHQRRKVKRPKKIEDVHRDAAQERHVQAGRMKRGPGPGPNSSIRNRQPMDFSSRGLKTEPIENQTKPIS